MATATDTADAEGSVRGDRPSATHKAGERSWYPDGWNRACQNVARHKLSVATSPDVKIPATFESFAAELSRLVTKFEREFAGVMEPSYSEARLRRDYLDPLFSALGWDMENNAGLLQHEREVEIESRTDIAGRAKRADYLFRTDGRDRLTCEAKKPRDSLGPRSTFQAKRYAWNKNLALALLSDFEELKVYVVGGKPHIDSPDLGLWRSWHFKQFHLVADEIWKLLARERVAAGSIEALLEALPKAAAAGRGKAKQLYIVRPDRNRALDTDFLNFLDEARRQLAGDLLKHNDRAEILEGTRLNEAVQSILDRLLFLRICEDRDIDTGMRLQAIVERWQRAWDGDDGAKKPRLAGEKSTYIGDREDGRNRLPREHLWTAIVRHIRALDRRPPSHVPFFNGNIFKPHPSEDFILGDEWLTQFIAELSADESPYLFNVIPVEILGSVYERFLGKIVRPHGRGVTIEEKPEVRKAGGVYYTPRYIVDYIVEQSVGSQLDVIATAKTLAAFDEKTRALRLLDPACGSGSFLIRAFERICEHWLRRLARHVSERSKDLCWADPVTGDLSLTVGLKRRILRDNIFGVDLDPQAVEVTQLSLYLKMLEGEDRATLKRQRELFKDDTALLPPLEGNVKSGNSLIASDFSLMVDDLVGANAFDWDVGFGEIMKAGGFDAVIGNPPWGADIDKYLVYFHQKYPETTKEHTDSFKLFIERSITLLSTGGIGALIVPNTLLRQRRLKDARAFLLKSQIVYLVDLGEGVFEGVVAPSCIFVARRRLPSPGHEVSISKLSDLSGPRKAEALARQNQATTQVQQAEFHKRPDLEFAAVPAAHRVAVKPLGELEDLACKDAGINYQRVGTGMQTKGKSDLAERLLYEGKQQHARDKMYWKGSDINLYWIAKSTERFCRPNYKDFIRSNEVVRLNEEVYGTAPKLLLRQTADRIIATIDHQGVWFGRSVIAILMNPHSQYMLEYFLGILNSKYLQHLYGSLADEAGRAFAQVKLAKVKQLPIRMINFSDHAEKAMHDQMVDLVNRMLALTPKLHGEARQKERAVLENALQSTAQKIDNLVYDLYGVLPEERAALEDFTR